MADVVVLGGGLGGVVAANRLRKLLPSERRVRIVERDPVVAFPPAFLRVLDGRREPRAITRDLRRLQRRDIDVTAATVTELDTDAGVVRTDAGDVSYDQLVVALGASLAPEAVPGFAEAAHNVYTLGGAATARDALRDFDGGTVAIAVASMPYKCPAAPYEAAMLADAVLRKRGVRDRCVVRLSAPEPAPLPVAGPLVGESVEAMLRERDIEYRPVSPLGSVDAAASELVFADGERVAYDLLLGVPAHVPPAPLQGTLLVNEAGWMAVDAATLETGVANVFGIGDAAGIMLPNGMPLPKAGVFAHGEAEAVAHTIAHRITGRGSERRFDGHGSCFVETGGGRAAYAAGEFYAEDAGAVSLRGPSRWWLWYKSLFERHWLWRWY
ncbi:MAG: FAD/NAD(P)-binding oxidoreductase [Dehalococcoidia bacterium]|jgi:sulfide:quinone oxidoreductase|nr:FAD/NAD(P)-binding oxidoreductase [Dehalococcoidia bacterium]